MLEHAERYLSIEVTATQCPVCEQAIVREHLLASVRTRIASMQSLSQANFRVTAARQQREVQAAQLIAAKVELAGAIEDFLGLCMIEPIKGLLDKKAISALEQINAVDSTSIETKIAAWHGAASFIADTKIMLEAVRKEQQTSLAMQSTIVQQLKTVEQKDQARNETNAVLGRLKGLLSIIESTRKEFVTGVLKEISKDVQDMYVLLHPGESIGKVRLELDPDKRGSLHLHGDFYTETGITPQSLYSESHLDTLGICVFLALAKKYRTDRTIIVLDDVVTSVDSEHLDRYIELIEQQSEHFDHMVVTTHYRPWRERYRNHRAPSGNMHFIELEPWSLEEGIRPYSTRLALAEVRQEVGAKPMDRQSVASKAGILMESLLDFLVRHYECRLPLRIHTDHTLRELADGISSKLVKVLRVERPIPSPAGSGVPMDRWASTDLKPLIDKIKGLAAVRNQVGCHFNYEADDVTNAEILEFGQVAIQFGELLISAEGGDLPTRGRSGSYWETKSGKVRLHPYAEPS